MLLSALKKKSLLSIGIIFAVFAILTLIFTFIPSSSQKTPTPQAISSTTQQLSPTSSEIKSLESNSFAHTTNDDLSRILFARDIFRETASYLTCQLNGVEPVDPRIDCITALSSTNINKKTLFKSGGSIAFASNAITAMYTQPVSAIDYSRHLANSFGIIKNANAQNTGTGFNSLNQIQNIWILFRNISYLLLVIIFVIVGILIMLRVNIDPRTVMTIQNQIPKAIVAIVLITFSYAIGGLLVDAMWIGTYFGINVITETQPPCYKDTEGTVSDVTLSSVVTRSLLDNPIAFTTDILGDETGCAGHWDGINGLVTKVALSFGDIFSRMAISIFGGDELQGDCGLHYNIKFLPDINVGNDNGSIGNCVKLAFFAIIKYLIAIIAYLVVLIAILAALFRVWFSLLKSYLFLILDIMLAPFYILLGLIPGSSLSFKGWLRGIIAQLAVFPAVTFLLVLASILAKNNDISNPTNGAFLPPLIGNPNIADNLGALLAFGLILLAPDIGNIVREALKAPASKNTAGIAAGVGLATGKVMGSGKDMTTRISERNDVLVNKRAGDQHKGLFRVPFSDKAVG